VSLPTHVPRHSQGHETGAWTPQRQTLPPALPSGNRPPPPPVRPPASRKPRRAPAWLPGFLLLLPSLVLIGIFVYGFLGWNVRVSFTNWRGLSPSYRSVGLHNYEALAGDDRFHTDVRNLIIFTVVFVAGATTLGFIMAMLLDKGVRGEGFFRGVFLFPMAISFIATAIVWRWLLDNGSGQETAGLNKLFADVGLGFLRSNWHKSDSPFAIAAVALPAGWALSGYVMALFLAGIRGVPDNLRESARLDGASESQVFWHVVRPSLRPITFSVILIMLHISLKTFDLLYAIDQGNLKIDTPSLYMWFTTFDGGFYDRGATIATVLLLGVALVVGPYVWYALRTERR
jgi:glucose/mannose transport system permease protein